MSTLQHLIGSGGNVTVTDFAVTADFPAVTLPSGVTLPLIQPVTEWSVSIANDTQETTDTGTGGWATFIAGINSWEGSATFFWDAAVTTLTAAAVFSPGRPISLGLKLGKYKITLPTGDDAPTFGASGYTLAGDALVSSFAIKNNVKGAVEITVGFKGVGASPAWGWGVC